MQLPPVRARAVAPEYVVDIAKERPIIDAVRAARAGDGDAVLFVESTYPGGVSGSEAILDWVDAVRVLCKDKFPDFAKCLLPVWGRDRPVEFPFPMLPKKVDVLQRMLDTTSRPPSSL
jgi:hypothetical protein